MNLKSKLSFSSVSSEREPCLTGSSHRKAPRLSCLNRTSNSSMLAKPLQAIRVPRGGGDKMPPPNQRSATLVTTAVSCDQTLHSVHVFQGFTAVIDSRKHFPLTSRKSFLIKPGHMVTGVLLTKCDQSLHTGSSQPPVDIKTNIV